MPQKLSTRISGRQKALWSNPGTLCALRALAQAPVGAVGPGVIRAHDSVDASAALEQLCARGAGNRL